MAKRWHWAPFRPLSWPANGQRAKVLHTGHSAICETPGGSTNDNLEIVDCKRCRHLASMATFEDTKELVPCVKHDDCREGGKELGLACRAASAPRTDSAPRCSLNKLDTCPLAEDCPEGTCKHRAPCAETPKGGGE